MTLEKVYKVLLAPHLSYERSKKLKHGCKRKSTNEHNFWKAVKRSNTQLGGIHKLRSD